MKKLKEILMGGPLAIVVAGLFLASPARGQDAETRMSPQTSLPEAVVALLPASGQDAGATPLSAGVMAAATEEAEAIPDFYQESGLNPGRGYTNDHASEYIDPFTGSLQLQFVDLVLPGNGGFDLRVQRAYSSNSINGSSPFYRTSLMGLGWTFHFGRIVKGSAGPCTNNYPDSVKGNPVLELPDGSRQILTFTGNASPDMLTARRWRADCKGDGTGVIVYAPDGTQYDMSQFVHELDEYSWYAKKITDRNGNTATLAYANPNGPEIASVTTSDGRSLTFTYADSGTLSHRITSITGASGQTYEYYYRSVPGILGAYYLMAVRRPDGSGGWGYLYNDLLSDPLAGSYRLKTVYHPYGGVVNYGYSHVNFDPQGTPGPSGRSVVVSNKSVRWVTEQAAVNWSYAYSPGGSEQYDTTTVTSPYATTVYRHIGPNYHSSGLGTVWMVGLLMEKQVGSSQVETYTWDKQQLSGEVNFRPGLFISKFDLAFYAPVMTGKLIAREGATYRTTYDRFDDYGNPAMVAEFGPHGGTRTKTFTYHIDPAKWIIHQVQNETTWVPTASDPDPSIQVGSITRVFDSNGNLTASTINGVTTQYAYDSEGNVSSTTFPRGLIHTYGNYKRGIPQSESQPEGITIERQVSAAGNVTYARNGEGHATRYGYDGLNRLTSIIPPTGNATTITYSHPSGSGNSIRFGGIIKTAQRGPLTQTTTEFDGFGHPLNIRLDDVYHFYHYDALGRRTMVSNPGPIPDPNSTVPYSNYVTRYDYDSLDRVVQVTHQDGAQRTLSHGAGARTVTDERGNATTYRYRAYGEPGQQFLMEIDAPEPAANVTLTRNGVDLVTTVTQDGFTRIYGYNDHYYLTAVDHPETGTTAYDRDEAGNMLSRKVGLEERTDYTYDDQNRLYSVDYPGNTPAVTHLYSKTGKLKSVSSSVATRGFDYDPNDNLTAESLGVDGYTFQARYAYNGNDRLSSITYPHSLRVVDYAPDALGRPTRVADAGADYVTAVDYWPSGQIERIAYGNGTVTEYGQSVTRLWPSSFQTFAPGQGDIHTTQYSYDGAGNLTRIDDATDANHRRELGYDALHRLTAVSGPWGSGGIAYTGGGNIARQTFGAQRTDYIYDGQNRLSRLSGAQTAAFGYDGRGNIVADARRVYEYDGVPNLRCASASAPCGGAASKIEYAYDGLNRRVWVNRLGVKTYEFHDAGGNLLTEFTPGQGNRRVEYYYLGGKRVAQRVSSDQPLLTVFKSGAGAGTVTSAPAGIDCGVDCDESYPAGAAVTLTATAMPGSAFVGWSGTCAGTTTTCTVTMDAAQTVTATFAPLHALTVLKAGTGAVTSSPAGIDCGTTCAAAFVGGTAVTLTAIPAADFAFAGWSGACVGAAATCTVVMDAAQTVTATFAPAYTLKVTQTGGGAGTVTSAPAGIDCGAICSAVFPAGAVVTLTATADPNSTFAGWNKDCAGVAATCIITMSDAKMAVIAKFNKRR